eukprot:CAMPEP_0113969930 /NCGR_PEP_ID=MMETSP0011_2-20120614/10712_1 /TAXON_ID=101924 /ORGANISM="Rhodosorus marinus" /LENGTH=45 /DNA_ID=CAMNT_0000983885 /DNA_START=854 /DNA_END=988 /DNA_ORIENTATION=- /assembly_acc=CAM_ASM_000156
MELPKPSTTDPMFCPANLWLAEPRQNPLQFLVDNLGSSLVRGSFE